MKREGSQKETRSLGIKGTKKSKQPRISKRGERGARGNSRSTPKLVKKIKETIAEKIANQEVKPTVGDLIKLLQFEKEIEEQKPKEIRVTWVEPSERPSTSET